MDPERAAMDGSRKPSSEDLADALRTRIRTGELKSGDSLPTQAVLAGEFGVDRGVVRQALQRLQGDGLLTAVTRGAPPKVASLPGTQAPQQTAAVLGARMLNAFACDDVRIDALCLTAESLVPALSESLTRITTGVLRPGSVKLRVLLPDREIDLAFPRRTEPVEGDEAVHDRWLDNRNLQAKVLLQRLEAVRSTSALSIDVTMRAMPFTPPVKLYVLNSVEALFAYYTVEEREEVIKGAPTQIYDALGSLSTLFRFESSAGVRDQQFVAESAEWFESLWNTIATPVDLRS
ncbi:FadR/GntR family transcriptional regulator [Streptomyces sp. OR43]|uniref:FadR/GntR family transcriptional regulator n=1 Tax=Streptomyces sp. or43 TaxID=2478957 RepID=UPI002905E752|nr:winged helix-turn-helix domain-containing protein [Streptomyces sp. or43]